MRKLGLIIIFLFVLPGCGSPSCTGGPGFGKRMSYYLEGGAPAEFNNVGEAISNDDGMAAITAQMAGMKYIFGLFRSEVDGRVREDYKFNPGDPYCYATKDQFLMTEASYPSQNKWESLHGTLAAEGDNLLITMPLKSHHESLADLNLTGSFDRWAAQDLIDEVRWPVWQNNVSTGWVTADCTLTGTYLGQPLEIGFSQRLQARSLVTSIP